MTADRPRGASAPPPAQDHRVQPDNHVPEHDPHHGNDQEHSGPEQTPAPRHALLFDRYSDTGRAIAALYADLQATAGDSDDDPEETSWEGADVIQILTRWFDYLGVDPRLRWIIPPPELDRDGHEIGDLLLIPLSRGHAEQRPDLPLPGRLACRYCGASRLRYVEHVEHHHPVVTRVSHRGQPVAIVHSTPHPDPDAVNSWLSCAACGHDLDWPHWLEKLWRD
jgi:hypothetical protein